MSKVTHGSMTSNTSHNYTFKASLERIVIYVCVTILGVAYVMTR